MVAVLLRLCWVLTALLLTPDLHAQNSQKLQGVDFTQYANEPGTDRWINSILNPNNSAYYEGTATPQRVVLVGIPAGTGTHTFTFAVLATKNNVHAYDFVTGYDQARHDYANVTGNTVTLNPAVNGLSVGPPASQALIQALYTGGNALAATEPAAAAYATLAGDNVAARVASYDASNGGASHRRIQLYGDAPIAAAALTFGGYTNADTFGDRYGLYTLTWTSAASNVLLLMGGHLALSGDGTGASYGPGRGASFINGGPYHFRLDQLDGASLGSQDNQIQTGAISVFACTLAVGTTAQRVSCYGGADGSISASYSGTATGTVRYSLDNVNFQASGTFSGLAAGLYTVYVQDDRCQSSTTATVAQPLAPLTASASRSNAACFGSPDGAVTLTVEGGSAPYSYLWSNGATTADLSGVAAGSYSVTVTDANGCTATATATVDEPALLTATATPTAAQCHGASDGTVALSVQGGTMPYSYLWSNGATSSDLSGVAAGAYSVTITDAHGCTTTASATVDEPDLLTASASATDAQCHGAADGTVMLAITGSTAPYSYAWSNGATAQNLSGVLAGTYSVTVTDAHGCTATAAATVAEPDLLTASATATDANCFGEATGAVTPTVTGGTAPYDYLWSNGATTATLSGVAAGAYSVTITDAHGCMATATATIGEPALLTAGISAQPAGCTPTTGNYLSNGTATVSPTGGTAPYAYLWSNGQTTATASGLGGGLSYSVLITDAHGCTATRSIMVPQQPCYQQHCTLTQGGYGNAQGVICKAPFANLRRVDMMTTLLGSGYGGNLQVGVPSATTRSLTFTALQASCLLGEMPAGGTAGVLAAGAFPGGVGNLSGCLVASSALLKNGKFNNVLIGQTIALSLNLRLDATLSAFPLPVLDPVNNPAAYPMTSYPGTSCTSPGPASTDASQALTRTIPLAVVRYLSQPGQSNTIGGLLALANRALGTPSYVPSGSNPSYADINAAVTAINELFDNCRWIETPRTQPAMRPMATAATTATPLSRAALARPLPLQAFPNPITEQATLRFVLPEAAPYTLQLLDMQGKVLREVGRGQAEAGREYFFAVGRDLPNGLYVVRLTAASQTQLLRLMVQK